MKVFLAGGSGALGARLIPQLVGGGHEVVALTRSASGAGVVGALGATPVLGDAFDRDGVQRAVAEVAPEVVIHQMTALRGVESLKDFDRVFASTNRLRTEGTEILLAAAQAAGARRFIAQSYAGWNYAPAGSAAKAEEDPFDPAPPARQERSLDAIRALERMVLGAEGIEGVVLRYGSFYGPGTNLSRGGDIAELVRKRRFPVVGDGGGVWSFAHVDDAAAATVAAMDRGEPGIYNVADDAPAPVAVWLPELARALGAKPPRRVPVWVGRLAAGEVGVSMMTGVSGASNAKARREGLGWAPRYATHVDGFRDGLGE